MARDNLAGRKALVTGAAGGIGQAVARLLDRQGMKLILVDRDQEAIRNTVSAFLTPPEIIACDLSDRADVERLCTHITQEHPNLHALVNNAGIGLPGPVNALEMDIIDAHLEINLRAPIRLMRAVAPLMEARGDGAMVATVSLGGVIALKDSAPYSASKFGLRGFLCGLHQELHPKGVKVSGIYPAAVDTPMLHHEATHGGSVLNFVDKVMAPEDVAQALLKGIETGKLEIYVPYSASVTARVAAAFPWMIRPLLPTLEKIGEAGRKKFVAKKGL